MRKAMILLGITLLLAACQPQETTMKNNDHLGCAPSEISEAGTCKPPSFQNAKMFHVDNLEEKITTANIDKENFQGYLAKPSDNETHPGVVMIHEWWGLNEGIKYMADILASKGYSVFAIDLYNGSVAETSGKASQLSGQVRNNLDANVQKMVDATQWLKNKEYVDEEKVASLGWCFGGGMSLQLALSEEPLAGTVIYYGTLTDNKTELEKIDWPVLGIFAEEDGHITPEMVRNFNQSMTELGKQKSLHIYPGVDHAFANPSGDAWAPNATKDAWDKTLDFLAENLK